MKMAKASPQDVDAALAITGILDAISDGYYPTDPAAPDTEEPTHFDPDDRAHLRYLHDLLKRQMRRSPGGIMRMVWGFATILDNDILDPALSHLELHPRLLAGLAAAEAQAARPHEVRVAGPDDVHRFDSELLALRAANQINQQHVEDCLKHPHDHVLCVAVVHPVETPSAAPVPA